MDTEFPEDWRGNPILSSPHTNEPAPRKKPSAALNRIILELGLRYRPTAAAQLEGHQAKIAALIADLIDVPLGPLEAACRQWVTRSPFMPKASDLIELARQSVAPPATVSVQAWCDQRNATMPRYSNPKPSEQIEWYADHNGPEVTPRLRWRDSWRAPHPSEYCTPEEARDILRQHPSGFARAILVGIEARDAR